jgi:hypothetical protein
MVGLARRLQASAHAQRDERGFAAIKRWTVNETFI